MSEAKTDGATTTDAAGSQPGATQPATTAEALGGALTAPQTAATTEGKAATDPAAADAKKDAPAGPPEKYELKLAEGALTAAEVADVEKFAKGLGLTQEQAQQLAQARADSKSQAEQAAREQLTSVHQQWASDLRADKEIGGLRLDENLATARKALNAFDDGGKLTTLLKDTGFGNHPEVVRFFLRVGKAIDEDKFVPAGGSTPAARDPASVLYPNASKG